MKTSRLVRSLFGLEAEIGLKNLKRNRKRYLATVFSLIISIVLFLSVSYFTDNLKKSLEMSRGNIQFDIQVYSGKEMEQDELLEYTKLTHVTKSTIVAEAHLESFVELENIPSWLQERLDIEGEKYPYYVILHGLDEDSFREYAAEIGVDGEAYLQKDNSKAVVIDQVTYEDPLVGKIVEAKTIEVEVGKTIELNAESFSENGEHVEKTTVGAVQIGALTDKVPVGVQTASPGGMNVIVPLETFNQIIGDNSPVNHFVYLNSSDPMATQEAIEERKDLNIYVYNVHQQRQRDEQTILLMSVFTYGFITLISLVSIANIFNTISTSISLRKREFAMLRSVGMTPKGFNKMINYESIFYGVKALAYGLPISVLLMYGIHRSLNFTFEYRFTVPWMSILFVIVIIFVIVGSAMLYSISKIKNENIIDSLKQENI